MKLPARRAARSSGRLSGSGAAHTLPDQQQALPDEVVHSTYIPAGAVIPRPVGVTPPGAAPRFTCNRCAPRRRPSWAPARVPSPHWPRRVQVGPVLSATRPALGGGRARRHNPDQAPARLRSAAHRGQWKRDPHLPVGRKSVEIGPRMSLLSGGSLPESPRHRGSNAQCSIRMGVGNERRPLPIEIAIVWLSRSGTTPVPRANAMALRRCGVKMNPLMVTRSCSPWPVGCTYLPCRPLPRSKPAIKGR